MNPQDRRLFWAQFWETATSFIVGVGPMALLFWLWRDGFWIIVALGSTVGLPLCMWMSRRKK